MILKTEDFLEQLAEEFGLSKYQVNSIIFAPLRRQAKEIRENTGNTIYHIGFAKFAWKNRIMVKNGKKKNWAQTLEEHNASLRENALPDTGTGDSSGEEIEGLL